MLGLDPVAIAKMAGAAVVALLISGAFFYVAHLRGQVADLTQANQVLRANVATANAAASESAKAALAIAQAGKDAQQSVETAHQTIATADLAIDQTMEDFHLAPLDLQICTAAGALPVAFSEALDRLFNAPAAGNGAGNPDGRHQTAGRAAGPVPALAVSAAAH